MKKRVFAIIVSLALCFLLCACAAKLTTINPALISRISVEDIATGEKAELTRKDNEETDWLMDDLVFQMEQFFKAEGECGKSEALYHAEYYMGDRLELSVTINSDGSICIDGKRYVQIEQGESVIDRTVNLDKWAECFEMTQKD